MKDPSQKRAKELATILHSRIVRARTPHCQAAETGVLRTPCTAGGLQCAHILSRRYDATRTHLENAWTLCAGHHRVIDTNPDLWYLLVRRTCGVGLPLYLRLQINRAAENGFSSWYGASKLTFWREELARMYFVAVAEQVAVTDLPKWLPVWVAEQHKEKAA